jgi:hypothetical protein
VTDIKADVVEEVSMVTSIQSSGSTVVGGVLLVTSGGAGKWTEMGTYPAWTGLSRRQTGPIATMLRV